MTGRIVVGVDGSAASKRALAWALDEARLRGDSLVVVHAWTHPLVASTGLPGGYIGSVDVDLDHAVESASRELLQRAVSEANTGGVEVEQRLVEGPAAGTLVEAAKGAELLVVGSRGHGGFAGLLLGSVSQQCAHYAPCPVVIIRAEEEADQGS